MGKPAAVIAASIAVLLGALAPPSAARTCSGKRQCAPKLAVSTAFPAAGVVSGSVVWEASVTSGSAAEVDFLVDGQQRWVERAAPYRFNGDSGSLDTRTLANGAHTLVARALSSDGQTTSSAVTVDVENTSVSYSPDRYVYCFGDVSYGAGGFLYDASSSAWIRQYPQGFPQRVSLDDSVDVGRLLGCHTLRNHLEPTDPSTNGTTDVQRADAYVTDSVLAQHGEPTLGDERGRTTYYGFAFQTSATFPVKPYPNWQVLWDFHHGGLTCAGSCYVNQQAVELDVQTEGSATTNCSSGSAAFPDAQPHIVVSVNGGNADNPNWTSPISADTTCLRFTGPAFVAGHRYRVAFAVTWGDHRAGAVKIWIDGVQYVDVSGIDNMLYSAVTGSRAGVYPKFANYRKYDPSYPATDVWFSGLVRGSTLADVTLP